MFVIVVYEGPLSPRTCICEFNLRPSIYSVMNSFSGPTSTLLVFESKVGFLVIVTT